MSETVKDGGQAFPGFHIEGGVTTVHGGMSLREYFAAAALTGVIASESGEITAASHAAKRAFKLADAMLEEGGKKEPFLWCCHVRGPDDVHATADYDAALKMADDINAAVGKTARKLDVLCHAVPARWPWSAELHAQDLAERIAKETT